MNKPIEIVVSVRTLDTMNKLFDKKQIGAILSHCVDVAVAQMSGSDTPTLPYGDSDYKTHDMMEMVAGWIIEDTAEDQAMREF